jgi:hypothetical protein
VINEGRDVRPAGGPVANRRSVAKRNRILVSREALRLGLGTSHYLARMAGICRLRFAPCRRRPFVSAEKSACGISDLCSRPVGCARRRLLAQRRAAAVALGWALRRHFCRAAGKEATRLSTAHRTSMALARTVRDRERSNCRNALIDHAFSVSTNRLVTGNHPCCQRVSKPETPSLPTGPTFRPGPR